MPLKSKFAIAWILALAPLLLFIPALMLAGIGPCAVSHPYVLSVAFLLFIVLEAASLPRFVRAARATGRAIGAMIGMGLAVVMLFLSAVLGYYTVTG
jgi:hypothetical protein